jgi:hypothetical protein
MRRGQGCAPPPLWIVSFFVLDKYSFRYVGNFVFTKGRCMWRRHLILAFSLFAFRTQIC